jgi:flagellar hook-length control protein FliK
LLFSSIENPTLKSVRINRILWKLFMSLPSFLIPSAAPVNASSFAGTTGLATNAGTTAGRGDFRQAFTQLTKGPMAEGQVSGATAGAAEAGGSPINMLNKLAKGEALSPEDREFLQRLAEDLELTPEMQDALAAVLQNAAANMPEVDVSLEGQPLSLKALVELLAGGKSLPDEDPEGAINLADEEIPADADISPFLLFNPTSSNVVADLPVEQGIDLNFMQRSKTEDGTLVNQGLAKQGINPDAAQPAKTLDGVLTNQKAVDLAVTDESPDPASLTAKFLTGTPEAPGKSEMLNFSVGAFTLPDGEQPDEAPLNQTSLVTALSNNSALVEQPSTSPLAQAMRMQVSFGNAQWSEALAERAAWLASQQIHSADIQLDPPELGPLQVRISVHQDQAVVSFVSANPQVREALDQSMARLRDLLQEQGMQLVDAGVSDQHRDDSSETAASDQDEQLGAIAEVGEEDSTATKPVVLDAKYGVDDFV